MRKTLKRLPVKQREQLLEIIRRIKDGRIAGMDVKKLQGRDDVYRVRKGVFRIIFRKLHDEDPVIIAIERRTDTTYNE